MSKIKTPTPSKPSKRNIYKYVRELEKAVLAPECKTTYQEWLEETEHECKTYYRWLRQQAGYSGIFFPLWY